MQFENKNLFCVTIAIFVFVGVLLVVSKRRVREHFSFLTQPVLKDGDQFMLKTLDGQYVSVCNRCRPHDANIDNLCGSLLCLTKYPYRSSVFTYHHFRDGRFAIETHEFNFWKHCDTCVHDCRGSVCGDGINKNLKTHKWILIKNGDDNNSVSIKSNTGRMIQRCDCSQTCGEILCTMGLGGNERFIVENIAKGPVEESVLRFRPRRYNGKIFNGVSLSMVEG